MKDIYKLTILLLLIPFFVVIFFIKEKDLNQEEPEFELNIKSAVQVRVKRVNNNNVELVPLEEYVLGVVAGEMPIVFELEALKAQAVAARSYVIKRIYDNKKKEYDVIDTVTNQVYVDMNKLKERWKENYVDNIFKLSLAVIDTEGQYLEYNGRVADALFFSTSNGFTENSEDSFSSQIPYLRSVESNWDKEASPVFYDHKNYTKEEFCFQLSIPCDSGIKVEEIKESSTGRVLNIRINGKTFKGKQVASLLKLRSNDFEIKIGREVVVVSTKGFGHGVGMSQYGANGMAKNGYHYDEILKYYYQNIKINKLI